MHVNDLDCFANPVRRPGGVMTYYVKRVRGKAQRITRDEYLRIRQQKGVVDLTPSHP